MFEILKIRLFGIQPTPSIDSKEISKIIRSDFTDQIEYVKSKLNRIESDSPKGKNRICAAILKLADGNLEKLDPIIDKANFDYRDIVSAAEYPRCSRFDFEERDQKDAKKEYLNDWKDYSSWLNQKLKNGRRT